MCCRVCCKGKAGSDAQVPTEATRARAAKTTNLDLLAAAADLLKNVCDSASAYAPVRSSTNATGYMGVFHASTPGKYKAEARWNGTYQHLGTYATALEAAEAYASFRHGKRERGGERSRALDVRRVLDAYHARRCGDA